MATHHELANFIWSVADLLRGPDRPPQDERIALPLTVRPRHAMATTIPNGLQTG